MALTEVDAVLAGGAAALTTAALTPLAARLARRVGAVDEPRERGLAQRETPLLGGLAILAGVVLASWLWLPHGGTLPAILLGAAVIAAVGAVDDVVDLPAAAKLAGQVGAVLIPVTHGVVVHTVTLPFLGGVDLGQAGGPLTLDRHRRPGQRRELLRRGRRAGRRRRRHRLDVVRDHRLRPGQGERRASWPP